MQNAEVVLSRAVSQVERQAMSNMTVQLFGRREQCSDVIIRQHDVITKGCHTAHAHNTASDLGGCNVNITYSKSTLNVTMSPLEHSTAHLRHGSNTALLTESRHLSRL